MAMLRRRLLERKGIDVEFLVNSTKRQRCLLIEYDLPRAIFISSLKSDVDNKKTSGNSAVKAKDERLYGGMRSWDILVSESAQRKPSPTSSKAWHAWQLFTATLPALAIYLISSSQEERATRVQDDDRIESDHIIQECKGDPVVSVPAKLLEDINRRLSVLESQIHVGGFSSSSSSSNLSARTTAPDSIEGSKNHKKAQNDDQ